MQVFLALPGLGRGLRGRVTRHVSSIPPSIRLRVTLYERFWTLSIAQQGKCVPHIACLLGALALTACKTTHSTWSTRLTSSRTPAPQATQRLAAEPRVVAERRLAAKRRLAERRLTRGLARWWGRGATCCARVPTVSVWDRARPRPSSGIPAFCWSFARIAGFRRAPGSSTATPHPERVLDSELVVRLRARRANGRDSRRDSGDHLRRDWLRQPTLRSARCAHTFASELRPQHHAQSCVSASADSAQITACEPTGLDSSVATSAQRLL